MSRLGTVISEHNGRIAAGGILWYIVGLMFVASVVGLFKEMVLGNWGNTPYFFVVGPLLGLVLLWLFSLWRQTLVIYTHGFVWNRLFRSPIEIRFDEIQDVNVTRIVNRKAMHLKGEHLEIVLDLRNGKSLKITNDLTGVEQLVPYVRGSQQSVAQAAPGASPGAPPASPWG